MANRNVQKNNKNINFLFTSRNRNVFIFNFSVFRFVTLYSCKNCCFCCCSQFAEAKQPRKQIFMAFIANNGCCQDTIKTQKYEMHNKTTFQPSAAKQSRKCRMQHKAMQHTQHSTAQTEQSKNQQQEQHRPLNKQQSKQNQVN